MMYKRIEEVFHDVGVPRHYRGYPYLAYAVLLATENPSRLQNVCEDIYWPTAMRFQTKPQNVHKNIRTIRDAMWSNKRVQERLLQSDCTAVSEQKLYPKELIELLMYLLRQREWEENHGNC